MSGRSGCLRFGVLSGPSLSPRVYLFIYVSNVERKRWNGLGARNIWRAAVVCAMILGNTD
jgi:hypothetical protein